MLMLAFAKKGHTIIFNYETGKNPIRGGGNLLELIAACFLVCQGVGSWPRTKLTYQPLQNYI